MTAPKPDEVLTVKGIEPTTGQATLAIYSQPGLLRIEVTGVLVLDRAGATELLEQLDYARGWL